MTLHQDIFIGRAVIHNLMLHHRGRQVMSRGHLTHRVALHRRPTTLDPLRLDRSLEYHRATACAEGGDGVVTKLSV